MYLLAPPPSPSTIMFGTLKGLDQSMNPQLIKYGRETDVSIAQARRDSRKRLFCSHQSPLKVSNTENINIEPYRCVHFLFSLLSFQKLCFQYIVNNLYIFQ